MSLPNESKKSTLLSLKKNKTQCSPDLYEGSVLQIINLGFSLISFNVSIENIPSKNFISYRIEI